METVGKRLIFLMENLDMKQIELAVKIGISKQSLYKYIHDLCEPRSEIIARMAVTLHTTADYIVGLTNDPAPIRRDKDNEDKVKWETALMNKIRHLTPQNQAKVAERVDMLQELQNENG